MSGIAPMGFVDYLPLDTFRQAMEVYIPVAYTTSPHTYIHHQHIHTLLLSIYVWKVPVYKCISTVYTYTSACTLVVLFVYVVMWLCGVCVSPLLIHTLPNHVNQYIQLCRTGCLEF